ncbi:antibiotic biosynthesis monooxygenase family protein [Lichenicola cladoniae]|uniref:hypothetical protein n=1 Tax=Lichenicola cladoniae TaxID=1484109 RepID=UPI001952E054|nr:hypothetical protein [Lichenicola cladoniae]
MPIGLRFAEAETPPVQRGRSNLIGLMGPRSAAKRSSNPKAGVVLSRLSGEDTMTFVSVTRLRIRSARFMPRFALYALNSLRQCKQAHGFLECSLLQDRKLTFWTMTLWRDQAAMRAYMTGGAHLRAMPKLQE